MNRRILTNGFTLSHGDSGFTLIEMVVVLMIIGLLSGMMISIPKESDHDRIKNAASELRGVLLEARSLAMRNGETYAVSFQVENAGDGSVMHRGAGKPGQKADREGSGHWYVIIGPDKSKNSNSRSYVPMFDRDYNSANGAKKYRCMNDFIAGMEQAQIGKRHYLPKNTRFLALSDEDGGHMNMTAAQKGSTYPRPWYGHYENGRLYTWGGYDRDLDTSTAKTLSGFGYAGQDGAIPYSATLGTNINPAQVWGRFTAFGEPRVQQDTGAPLPRTTSLAGTPRPVLNAMWGDYLVVFGPDGHAFTAVGHARIRAMDDAQWNISHMKARGVGLATSRVELTGGIHLTIARDIDEKDPRYIQMSALTGAKAYNLFPTAQAALDSIKPFARVYVQSSTGEVEVRDQSHPACRVTAADMAGNNPAPGL